LQSGQYYYVIIVVRLVVLVVVVGGGGVTAVVFEGYASKDFILRPYIGLLLIHQSSRNAVTISKRFIQSIHTLLQCLAVVRFLLKSFETYHNKVASEYRDSI